MAAAAIKTDHQVPAFTSYQKFVIALLAFLQFTIILDFMMLSPLGAMLMPALHISPSQFGWVVSAYAFSAGSAGFLAAGFADRFDRKKLLLFFYTGFVVGTLLCGIANSYEFLLGARIVTGLFGGVIGSISFAIITDLFVFQQRGRVMGIVQTAFAGSQIMGLPIGLYLANLSDWHAPFLMVVVVSFVVGILIVFRLRPVDAHLKLKTDRKAIHHLKHTLTQPRYVQGFATTALLSTGGFMLMPFGSAFSVNNLGVDIHDLPMVYMVTGCVSMIVGPFVGRLADKLGSYPTFLGGSVLTMVVVAYYTRLFHIPLWLVIAVSCFMFAGVSARMVASSTLLSVLPAPTDRGSFMSVSSSLQQISGGLAAVLAGMIVVQNPDQTLSQFDQLGNVVIASTFITIVMMYYLNRYVQTKKKAEISKTTPPAAAVASH